MNFNIYLDDKTAQQLQDATEISNESRNSIIRQAISFWLQKHHKKKWPDSLLEFNGMMDFPAFESSRDELLTPKDDPFQ